MLEIENTLLTGAVQVDSDSDGNVRILQNKQEIKLTLSQAKELREYLQATEQVINVKRDSERLEIFEVAQ